MSWGAQVCVTNFPGIQSQRIQNAADDKQSALRTQETNGLELLGVYSPLPLLNSKNLLSQNKTDHIQLNGLHYLSEIRRREALWTTVDMQQNIFLGPTDNLLMLIKNDDVEMV
jgi:hypothetical protein